MAKSEKITSHDKATHDSAEKNTGMLHPVTSEQRYHYVEVAAYYIAEKRGFDAGSNDEDWAQAELEIDRLLAEGQINH
ncbi:MAG: DUF2934 domain-containing protein [Sterolibacterium sp.]